MKTICQSIGFPSNRWATSAWEILWGTLTGALLLSTAASIQAQVNLQGSLPEGRLEVSPGMLSGSLDFFASPPGLTFASPLPYGVLNNLNDEGWIWNDGSFLTVEFPTPVAMTRIRVYCVYNGGERGAKWTIEHSGDSSSWLHAADFNYSEQFGAGVDDAGSAVSGTGGWYSVAFNPEAAPARYWRIRQTDTLISHAPRSGEMEFYGIGGSGTWISSSPWTLLVREDEGQAIIKGLLWRGSNATDLAVSVEYATADDTARADEDYARTSGTLLFAPGETNKAINVPILNDRLWKPERQFRLLLSNPSPGVSLGHSSVVVRIQDDDLGMKIEVPQTRCATGVPVPFAGQSTLPTTVTVWNFGDGTVVSNRPSLSHAWARAGSYAVTLTGYNDLFPEGVISTVKVEVVDKAVRYVNLKNPNPMAPFGSWAAAATNIQDAVDAAEAWDTVLVTNGVYAVGAREISIPDTAWGVFNIGVCRVVVTNAIRLESVNGAPLTIIDGGGSVRGVFLGAGAILSGFTLTNGSASWGGGVFCEPSSVVTNCTISGNSAADYGGGAATVIGVDGFEQGACLNNCTIEGNSARFSGGGTALCNLYDCSVSFNSVTGQGGGGGGAFGGTLSKCRLTGNGIANANSDGGGAAECTLYDCTLTGNCARNGGGAYGGILYNCTLTGNSAYGSGGGVAGAEALFNCTLTDNWARDGAGGVGTSRKLLNCIIYYNSGGNYSYEAKEFIVELNYCCTTPLPTNGVGNITGPPLFMDMAGGVLRLREDSPCTDAGTNLVGFTFSYPWDGSALRDVVYRHDSTDKLGYPRGGDGNDDGKSGWDIGAYEYDPTVPIITQASITPAGLTIQWNATAIGAKLQRATSLTQPDWVEMFGSEKTNRVVLPIYSGNEFFRLVGQGNPDPQHLVWIPPGTFMMGSPTNEVDRSDNEGPQTAVTLTKGFWMGKYEVTQGEYEAVMGSNPSAFGGDTNRPVEQVRWEDATNYCATLTQRERAAGRIATTSVYRLPTEAEWEYACRAGTSTRFSYGDDPGFTNLANYAWYSDNSIGTTHPVGQKLPNPWGLYDMHGNVREWCQDWFDSYPGGIAVDPQGPAAGLYRVVRGGQWRQWFEGPGFCRSAYRYGITPDYIINFMGFRVVLAPGQP